MSLLEVHGLGIRFGGVRALQGIDLRVDLGTVHGVIGPNGAGKTTLLNCIGRILRPSEGQIEFAGVNLLAKRPHDIAALGIARTFQNLALLDNFDVLDNVRLGHAPGDRRARWRDFLPLPSRARADAESRAAAIEALAKVGLERFATTPAGALPYGVRKSVEIARALCARPRLLMLDEPTAGLNAGEMSELAEAIHRLRADANLTIVLITHHIEFLTEVADRVTVLDAGRVIADGLPQLVQTDETVRTAYLGVAA